MKRWVVRALVAVLCVLFWVSTFTILLRLPNNLMQDHTDVDMNDSLPAQLKGTNVLIKSLVICSRADENMPLVSGLLVANTGGSFISEVHIGLSISDKDYTFSGTWLPPGGVILIHESTGALISSNPEKIQISGWATEAEEPFLSAQRVKIIPQDMNCIAVQNLTDDVMQSIKIYYRTYFGHWNLYYGGICNKYTVVDLQPGESRLVYLPDYDGDYSLVLGALVSLPLN